MNIWCISKYASPPKYGVGARIFYLAKEFVASGHKVVLLTSDSNHLAQYPSTESKYNFEEVDGVNFIWTKNKKYSKTASISRVLSWFDLEYSLFKLQRKDIVAPDVIIVSSLSLLSIVYGYFLKRKYRAKLILEIRDIWPLTLVEEGGVSKFHPLAVFLSLVEKFGYKKSDLIVGTMPRLDLHIKEILGKERPFFCSPLGFDETVMARREYLISKKILEGFPSGKLIVGYAGSMGISNNLDSFIKCIIELKDNDRVHFMLVGSGDKREQFEALLSGQDNVTFLDKIQPDFVPGFLNLCDVLYLSTHDSIVWKFGQSMNKVVEYMYSGKPIIASYSGYRSMLNEADSGVFVQPNNVSLLRSAIQKMINLPEKERIEMGLRGRQWIKQNRTYKKLAIEYLREIKLMNNFGEN